MSSAPPPPPPPASRPPPPPVSPRGPPPPPAPPTSTSTSSPLSPASLQQHCTGQPAKPFAEQLEAAARFVLGGEGRVLLVACRRHRSGALQDGPKCGMVAMTMAAEALLGENDKAHLEVEDVFAAALKGGHSKKGELFSAAAVASLCRSLVPSLEAEEITDLSSALSSPEAVARMFFPPSRRVLLVPYDVDKDQSPCLKRGTKAHWCLVLGGAFLVEEEEAVGRLKSLPNVESIADGRILLLPEDDDKHAAPPEEVASSCSKVFLLARQSKSRRIFLYGLEELLASNSNLVDSGADGSGEFALPEGGVDEGLKGKAVLIEPSIL